MKISFPCAAALLALGLCAAGCRSETPADPPEAEHRRRFGDPYALRSGPNAAAPDAYPMLRGDTLVALVSYPGGCKDHDFALKTEAAQDTAKMWLLHDAHGDDCAETVEDELLLAAPASALGRPVVVVLDPEGATPFFLRRP